MRPKDIGGITMDETKGHWQDHHGRAPLAPQADTAPWLPRRSPCPPPYSSGHSFAELAQGMQAGKSLTLGAS